jgi:hydrophobic/amphiphilic exporter-1 (mainly G- bacteria), HAE1 family
VIFLPLIFVGGVLRRAVQGTGLRHHVLAGCALLVALSLVPMLASRLLSDTRRQVGAARYLDGATVARPAPALRRSTATRDLLRAVLRHRAG